jgi:hypothetical protein
MWGLLYALLSLVALISFVFGLGSAGMNGVKDSSLGACLAISGLSAAGAWAIFYFTQGAL